MINVIPAVATAQCVKMSETTQAAVEADIVTVEFAELMDDADLTKEIEQARLQHFNLSS